MGDVPYAKGDCISVELPVRKTQAFGVFLGPDKTFQTAFLRALHADAQHFRVDIRHGDRRPFAVQAKGNVTGAARHIEDLFVVARLQTAAEQVFPERSEERRVGKEFDSPCRSRWSPYH